MKKGSRHFATPPRALARQISTLQVPAKPSGSIRVTSIIGQSRRKTSIFRDNKTASYFLPIKASVRSAEQVRAGESVTMTLIVEAGTHFAN